MEITAATEAFHWTRVAGVPQLTHRLGLGILTNRISHKRGTQYERRYYESLCL